MNPISIKSPMGRTALAATAMLVLLASLALASGARAAELVYWDNYRAVPSGVSVANIDGTGGGALSLAGATLKDPEGMAFDSATGRLYLASNSSGAEEKGEILYVNVDGSGAGVLSTPGAEVNDPYGVAIDPATRMIYWTNGAGGPGNTGSIGYASLEGTGGGLLNTTGVTVQGPYRLAIDPTSGKVFWENGGGSPYAIAYANLNNTGGGGTLPTPAPVNNVYGLAVDSAAGLLYWLDSTNGSEKLTYVSVSGSGAGGEVPLAGAVDKAGYGLAIDSALGRIYWGNYGNAGSVPEAIGFVSLAGGGGAITPSTAPVDGAQDPVILKSPVGTEAPVVSAASAKLTCSTGGWAGDLAASFVYQAPRTLTYQWAKGGAPIAGATAATYTATAPGTYTCTVTAANQAGSAAQASAAAKVKAAKFKLVLKTKKAKAKAGKLATIRVQALNQGDLRSKSSRICVKLTKQQLKALKQPKCKQLGKVSADKRKTVKLKVKVKPDAEKGLYKLKLVPKGTGGKAVTAKLQVIG